MVLERKGTWGDRVKHARVLKVLRRWQQRLHLDDWDVGLTTEAGELLTLKDGSLAYGMCDFRDSGARAEITLVRSNNEVVEGVVVHELLHLMLAPLVREGRRLAENMTPTQRDLAHEHLTDCSETAVDRLTKVLLEMSHGRDGT